MPILTTAKARRYKPAISPADNAPFEKATGVLWEFDPLRIRIQHNKVYPGAVAILIDNVVVDWRDSYSALTDAVTYKVYEELTGFKQDYTKAQRLYDMVSGADEGANFWEDK